MDLGETPLFWAVSGEAWDMASYGWVWAESDDRLWTIWCEKEQISSIETRPLLSFSNVFFPKITVLHGHVSSYRLEDSETSCWNQPKTEVLTILPEAVQLLGFLQVCLPGQWHVLSLELSSLWPLHVQRASIGLWKRWLGTWRRRWCQWLWTASMTWTAKLLTLSHFLYYTKWWGAHWWLQTVLAFHGL